ncbi:UDP-2,4-diacetamido-2,4,6-trideoxy-beta-L-altropyranose hydrolase [Pectinatus frisingensis]|uniref:UDP-2,4-diacetamido-2,4, 6-trideoxy-beta-L-altropyranose hydrolase n=1 Tax=Pectinatus frisingensis TaxID=865 RepID=UPI001E3E6201|nr:UDP-2,4-diacetamido-2,4,6-trideoxy-beta-L-altropyranose hydrolase [Pectinatus frisingensis]
MMVIVFRVDSSIQIGSGHLMRCLTLAGQLQKKSNANIIFICRNLEGNLSNLVKTHGYKLILLPAVDIFVSKLDGYAKWLTVSQDYDAYETMQQLKDLSPVDYIVVDSYAIDKKWEIQIRPYVNKIMVIDDLANRKHDCDILLDQNFYLDNDIRYIGMVPQKCKMLLGPRYALLRDEFHQVKNKMRIRDGSIKNILIFFGGSDLTNETMKALKAIALLRNKDITVNVITGENNSHNNEIEKYCTQYDNIHYYCQVDNMAEFMNEADIAIGAGGTTTWERCFLGLPAIVIAVAENQVKICEDCAKEGFIIYLGYYIEVNYVDIYQYLGCLNKASLSKINKRCLSEKMGNIAMNNV